MIAQAVLGEEVGVSHFWTVEHYFLSEFSHCSAPSVCWDSEYMVACYGTAA